MGQKGDRTKVKIIESATYCLIELGDRKTTFQTIAEHSGFSQGLIVRYLKTRDNIFPEVLQYWINWARQKTEKALLSSGSPELRLKNYLQVSIDLFNKSEFAHVYLLLHAYAGVEERYRLMNSDIKNVAVQRVAKIIQDGIESGQFRDLEVLTYAKTIHNNLVGHVLSALTESRQPYHLRLPKLLEETCLQLLRK
jgi:AcrR family transcriptional regulator